jgi:predicted ester cyclase
VDELLADGDRVIGRWTMRATHEGSLMGIPATGKPVVMSGIDIARWEDGKLVELWHIEDVMSLMMQLGVFPGFG